MEWLEKVLEDNDCPECGQNLKLFQTKINRSIADDFKMMCIDLGKSQKEVVEEMLESAVTQYLEVRENA